jgi:hypothetical protein
VTELGAQKIQQLADIAEKAGKAGVSFDAYQRAESIVRGLGLSVESTTDAIRRFNDATVDPRAGEFGRKLQELRDIGNFSGNSGVAAYEQAASTEQRYRAAIGLITEAIDRGERLAGIDLASTFLPKEIVERLRTSGDFLDRMQSAADRVAATKLIAPEEISKALELKRRMEDAQKVIAERWLPVQKDLTGLGLNFQESQVAITELMAKGAGAAGTMYGWIKGIPDILRDAGNAPLWGKLANALPNILRANVASPADQAAMQSRSNVTPDLVARLLQPAEIERAMREATDIAFSVFGDRSAQAGAAFQKQFDAAFKSIAQGAGDAGTAVVRAFQLAELTDTFNSAQSALTGLFKTGNVDSAEFGRRMGALSDMFEKAKAKIYETKTEVSGFDQALSRANDRIDELRAEAQYASKSAEAVQRLRFENELRRAADRAGLAGDAQTLETIRMLGEEYGAMARAAQQAKIAADIQFDRSTMFLSDSDQGIANKLRPIYGDNVDGALRSQEAAQMRFNDQLRESRDLSTQFATSFVRDVRGGVPAVQALINALGKLADQLIQMATNRAITSLFSSLASSAFGTVGGAGSIGANPAGALGALYHSGGVVGSTGAPSRLVHPAYFDDAPRYHTGGLSGLRPDEVPAILQRGERVLPRGQAWDGGGAGPKVEVNVTNNYASGVEASVQQRRGPDGSVIIDVAIGEFKKRLVNGDFDRVMAGRFGIAPTGVRR